MFNLKAVVILIHLVFIAFIQSVQATEKHTNHSLVGSHGMVLFSNDKVNFFVSHLPLYYSPHNYQIVYKINVSKRDELIKLLSHGMVTVLPENFDLNLLIQGKKITINTQFFEGHFERGGKAIYSAPLTFESAIIIKKISPDAPENIVDKALFYREVISNTQAIVIHKITPSPSFDAIGFIELTKIKRVKPFTCEQPDTLTDAFIRQHLALCGITDIQYIETKDFN